MRFICLPFGFKERGGFNLEPISKNGPSTSPETSTFHPSYPPTPVSPIEPITPSPSSASPSPPQTTPSPLPTSTKRPAPIAPVKSKSDISKTTNKDSGKNEELSDLLQPRTEEETPRRKRPVLPSKVDSSRPISEFTFQKYEKDPESVAMIKTALNSNDFIKNIMDEERLGSVVEAMNSQEYEPDSYIIKEGETGSHLYVAAVGEFEVIKGGEVIKKFGPGEAFGELAILYKAKRFASIRVTTKAKVWVLERRVFQKIMIGSGKKEQEDNLKFLSSVPIFQGVQKSDLIKVADFLKREFFLAGTKIIRQGEKGDKFYIIRGGTVAITKRLPDGSPETFIKDISRGEWFGEQALLYEDKRLATITAKAPGVECLTLDRVPFNEFLGNIDELRGRPVDPRPSGVVRTVPVRISEFDHVQLDELEIVGTLGVGGFGRVELVQYTKDRSKTFALKCLKKIDVVNQQQQENAFNEKSIMVKCDSPFICKLYKTYKDNKYLYFLMEPLLGGDVWAALQKKRLFSEPTARFVAACVVEAFEYLHIHNIIYRDLKPENLMLDSKGYVKLVDFGYAKYLSSGFKSYTFAGTPEYVAPEIIRNLGHDRSVDCWALGIFIHELLCGKPPFRGTNHMRTYNLILKGIDAVEFNSKISKVAQVLIKKLCRPVPAERLGYLKNGIKDVKNHKWFLGFDWEKLKARKITAPLVMAVSNNTDLSNFEKYPKEKLPPDETSGWDADF